MTASSDSPDDNTGELALRLPARLEDRFHRFREKRARKRGLTPTVIPYAGYGSTSWIRVLSRVLLSKPGALDDIRYKKIRGWRSFTSVPVTDVTVIIGVGGVERRVTADRGGVGPDPGRGGLRGGPDDHAHRPGGVVDEVIEVSLSPGWHTITVRTEESESVEAPVFVVDPNATIGVISDVDDTVMVTALPRPLLAAWNTFVLDEHARTHGRGH